MKWIWVVVLTRYGFMMVGDVIYILHIYIYDLFVSPSIEFDLLHPLSFCVYDSSCFFPISDVWVDFKPHLIPHGWVQYHVPPGVASWELGVWGQRSPETGGGWQRLHCAEVPGQQGG